MGEKYRVAELSFPTVLPALFPSIRSLGPATSKAKNRSELVRGLPRDLFSPKRIEGLQPPINNDGHPLPTRMNGAQWYGWGYSNLTCSMACCKASVFILPQTN